MGQFSENWAKIIRGVRYFAASVVKKKPIYIYFGKERDAFPRACSPPLPTCAQLAVKGMQSDVKTDDQNLYLGDSHKKILGTLALETKLFDSTSI